MSGSKSRSRRRTGSTSRRYKPSELVPIQPRRRGAAGAAEIAAAVGVMLVAIALIVLIWVVSMRNINEQTAEIQDRAERMVTAQAVTLAEEIRQELAMVDQSLTILQEAWSKDSEHFELLDWQKQMPALTSVAKDIFIADEKRVVRQDIMPQAIGQGVGGPYLNFPLGTLEVLGAEGQLTRTGQLIIADSGGVVETRRYLMYIVRPLASPTNWLIGASYRTEELTKLYRQVSIGINGVVALMDSQLGTLQAIAGPAARRPQVDLSKSAMLTAFRTKASGYWTGSTAMDGVQRIHGFAKVPGRDMYVTVAIVQTEAMAAADTIGIGVWWVAFSGSVLVVGIAGLILWEIFNLRANRRQQRNYTRMQSDTESLQHEVLGIRIRSAVASSQVAALLRVAAEALALLDADLNLIAWNEHFAADVGVPSETLRVGLPIDELIRCQAQAGLIGALDKADSEAIEAEIAARVAMLRTEPGTAALPQLRPDGHRIAISAEVVPNGGGLILFIADAEM
jgi:PAS domain-containing protein